MKELFLMRHGITWENKAHIFIGQNDPPLIDEAVTEINEIKSRILTPDLILSSDLKRASETAKLLFPKQEITFLSQLRERHWGSLQGKSRSLFKGIDWHQQDGNDSIYSEAGAESLSSIASRIKYVLNKIKESNAKSILIVSHGSYLSYFINILLSEKFVRHPLKNLHYHKIVFDSHGKIIEAKYNQSWKT